MVSAEAVFLIDTTFIFTKIAETFHGARLLVADGKDVTFTYGFLRDLLRLRRQLGVRRGIVAVGSECHDVATDIDVEVVVDFARRLGLPVVHEGGRSTFDLCYLMSGMATYLVTNDTKLIQLATQRLSVLRPSEANEYECLTPMAVSSRIGVSPSAIPTFLALHNPAKARGKAGPLTRRQAIRLVELYGDLENIYANVDASKAATVCEKLASGRESILDTYRSFQVDTTPVEFNLDVNRIEWRLSESRVAAMLRANRFHSLVRLLPWPDDVRPVFSVQIRDATPTGRCETLQVCENSKLRSVAPRSALWIRSRTTRTRERRAYSA